MKKQANKIYPELVSGTKEGLISLSDLAIQMKSKELKLVPKDESEEVEEVKFEILNDKQCPVKKSKNKKKQIKKKENE